MQKREEETKVIERYDAIAISSNNHRLLEEKFKFYTIPGTRSTWKRKTSTPSERNLLHQQPSHKETPTATEN